MLNLRSIKFFKQLSKCGEPTRLVYQAGLVDQPGGFALTRGRDLLAICQTVDRGNWRLSNRWRETSLSVARIGASGSCPGGARPYTPWSMQVTTTVPNEMTASTPFPVATTSDQCRPNAGPDPWIMARCSYTVSMWAELSAMSCQQKECGRFSTLPRGCACGRPASL